MRSLFNSMLALSLLVGAVTLLPLRSIWAQEAVPRFEKTECVIELPDGVIVGEDVECGYLVVPEEHANPSGKTIKLAVMLIKSFSDSPAPDPLIVAQGGPGGSTIDYYASVFFGGDGNAVLENRDVILFDQRGTYYSKPSLLCTEEETQATVEMMENNLTAAEENALYIESAAACYERLSKEGINLSAFDSVENAADVEALRQVLGYEQFNFYGVSYGTMLGQHVLRDQSAHLRSIILDANVPLSVNFLTEVPANVQEVFGKLFAACANDPTCASSYPDLETTFYDLVDRLNQKPISFPLNDPYSGESYEAVLTGNRLMLFTFQMMYASFLLPQLPEMILDVQEGDTSIIAQYAPFFLFDPTFADGMYLSTLCAEDSDFTLADQPSAGVRPEIVEYFGAESFLGACEAWQVDQLGAEVDEPVVSEVPTLVMNGEFDPITPPKWGELVASTLPNSFVITFPGQGHGNFLDSPCATAIGVAFLNDPTLSPDSSCTKDMGIIFTVKSPGNYEDADGLFTFPIPGGWEDQSTAERALYVQPGSGAQVFVTKVPNADVDAAFEAVLANYQIDTSIEPEISELDLPNGVWTRKVYSLQDGTILRVLILPTDEAAVVTGATYAPKDERATRQALTLVVDGLSVNQ